MTDLEAELIDFQKVADDLCNSLKKMAQEEIDFGISIRMQLEKLSWETYCIANSLKALRG